MKFGRDMKESARHLAWMTQTPKGGHDNIEWLPELYADSKYTARKLIKEEEKNFIERIRKGDKDAHEEFVIHNLGLVINIASHYAGTRDYLCDLVQEGMIGLLSAIDNFDPGRNLKFSTFAVHRIRSACQKALSNYNNTFYLPNHVVTRVFRLRRSYNKLFAELSREPTLEELCEDSDVEEHYGKILYENAVLRNHIVGRVIKEPPTIDPEQVEEHLYDERTFDGYDALINCIEIDQRIDLLTPVARKILTERFGLNGKQVRIWKDIANDIPGQTRASVKALAEESLRALRNYSEATEV